MLREAYTIFKKWNIDDVLSFKLQMPQSAFLKRDSNQILIRPQEWRCRDYEIPTISLDLGVHLYSIAQFFLGFHLNFVDIKARHSSSNQIENVIDDVTILAKLDSGIFMDLWFSKVAIGHLNGLSFSIFAKRGALHWNQEKPDILRVTDPDGTIKILKRGDFGLQVANQNRYTRFKGGHPTGFVEALTNHYLDIFHHYLNAKLGIQYFSESEVMPVFTFKSSLDGLNFFQSAFTKKIV